MNKYQKKKVSNSKTPFYYYKVDSKGKKKRVSKEEYQMKGGKKRTNISNIDSLVNYKSYMDKAKYYTSGVFKGKKLKKNDLINILGNNDDIISIILRELNFMNLDYNNIYYSLIQELNNNKDDKHGTTIKEIISIINRLIDYHFKMNKNSNANENTYFKNLITKITIIEGFLKHIKYLAIKNIN